MAKSDRADEVSKALESMPNKGAVPNRAGAPGTVHASREDIARARRIKALEQRLKGKSYREIGESLGVSADRASQIVQDTLERAENAKVADMREIENQRLDLAQTAIWRKVLSGNIAAIETFLKISARRSKMNGLDSPQQVAIRTDISAEMQDAFNQLEAVLQAVREPEGVVLDAEVVPNDSDG